MWFTTLACNPCNYRTEFPSKRLLHDIFNRAYLSEELTVYGQSITSYMMSDINNYLSFCFVLVLGWVIQPSSSPTLAVWRLQNPVEAHDRWSTIWPHIHSIMCCLSCGAGALTTPSLHTPCHWDKEKCEDWSLRPSP